MAVSKGGESFLKEVVQPIRIAHAGRQYSLKEYVELPKGKRSGDEAAVVDALFTPRFLSWLGYSDTDWIYNRSKGEQERPDFQVVPQGATAFLVEDKNTTEEFAPAHVAQMRRYTSGTTGYALWTNARTIIALRFQPKGNYEVLAHVDIAQADESANEASFALLHLLFRRERYVELPAILDRIAVDEEHWERTAISADGAREEFIASTKSVLREIAVTARAQVEQAEAELTRSRSASAHTAKFLQHCVDRLISSLESVQGESRKALAGQLRHLVSEPGSLDERQLAAARPKQLTRGEGVKWQQAVEELSARVIAFREQELPRSRLRKIATAYEIWKERYKIIEDEGADEASRLHAYSEQVAYTFFARLLLARILEDRKILPRLISDGGLRDWRNFLKTHFDTTVRPRERAALMPEALLSLLYRSVSRYYKHFFSQPVFDWFEPDDYLLATALDKLSRYDFTEIEEDILGFTYEAYIDEVARLRKGHFLTPSAIVDLMLDQAGYAGREIIGKRLIDPSVGSGSFLVHAARRLRDAIDEATKARKLTPKQHREEVARAFIRHVQRDLYGLEINPFSCYLSELNLFIQLLDDLVYLWSECGSLEEVDRFQVFNTNSLELPRRVLFQNEQLEDDFRLDEAWPLKNQGEGTFDFVVGNPPYVNRGVIVDAPAYQDVPFYRTILSGDQNTYLLFLKVAAYYAGPECVVSQIIPVNIIGDSSTEAARRLLDSEDWSVSAITRFYRREVLFEGVLQRVCTVTAKKTKKKSASIIVSGGRTVEDAQQSGSEFARADVMHASMDSQNKNWAHAWLVSSERIHYEIWNHIRGNAVSDLQSWTRERVKFQKGDVNKTRTKIFRSDEESTAAVPITCADKIENFGPWERDTWLDPAIDLKRARLSKKAFADARRERDERILRVAELEHVEWVLGLKSVTGMEAIRPIRGTLLHRSAKNPFLLDDTMQVAFALRESDNEMVQAVFGLLVSAVPNFIFQAFSTNANMTREALLRTPIPNLERMQRALARLALDAQQAGEALHKTLARYGGALRLAEISLDMSTVLRGSKLPCITLEDAVSRGILSAPSHPAWKVARSLSNGDFKASAPSHEAFARSAHVFLSEVDEPYQAGGKAALLPSPASFAKFEDYRERAQTEGETSYQGLLAARARLDELVFSAYEIRDEEWQRAILHGMPWAVEGREEMKRVERKILPASAAGSAKTTATRARSRRSSRR